MTTADTFLDGRYGREAEDGVLVNERDLAKDCLST
jgi:hypothetical protein